MTYDLRDAHWLPFRRASGRVDWGSPAFLVEGLLTDDPIVALATPRPDFDGALLEFLIGLLSAALAPADETEWAERWNAPPTCDELWGAFAKLPPAFDLEGNGDGPRAFQDLTTHDFTETGASSVAQLLIDSPGEQGIRQNKDLFVKRDRVARLSRSAGAMAVITLQTYAPAGGAGNRTSLRGGGPLTTLVDPRPSFADARYAGLWYMIWANVETIDQREARVVGNPGADARDAFPWLDVTRQSNPKDGGKATTPADVDPLQAYFGLPRRLRLDFGPCGPCDLTGRHDDCTVTGFRQRPWGVQYLGWQHPLSPYYETKDGWLPLHGQSEGISWRDWLGLVVADGAPGRRPAQTVTHFLRTRGPAVGCRRPSIVAFGYDMENMKARGWIDARLPALVASDADAHDRMVALVRRLTEGTALAASGLLYAVKNAMFGDADVSGDLSHVKQALWNATESSFHEALDAIADGRLTKDAVPAYRRTLERHTLSVFDRAAGTEATAPDAMRRLVGARYSLSMQLTGKGKAGEKLFAALGLPAPEAPRSRTGSPDGQHTAKRPRRASTPTRAST